jgi:TonB family protein
MRPRVIAAVVAASFIACTAFGTASWPPPNVTGLVAYAPKPEYPPFALKHGFHGTGIFLMRVHIASGRVTQVIVGLRTGSKMLDVAAVKTLQSWRFKPGTVPYRKITSVQMSPPQGIDETLVKVTISFGL